MEMYSHSSTLAWKIQWTEEPGRQQSMGSLSRTRLSNFTFTFHFHALEKEMATHCSVLAWRIPGTGEPSGLPSMGSQSRTRLKRLSSSRRIQLSIHSTSCHQCSGNRDTGLAQPWCSWRRAGGEAALAGAVTVINVQKRTVVSAESRRAAEPRGLGPPHRQGAGAAPQRPVFPRHAETCRLGLKDLTGPFSVCLTNFWEARVSKARGRICRPEAGSCWPHGDSRKRGRTPPLGGLGLQSHTPAGSAVVI